MLFRAAQIVVLASIVVAASPALCRIQPAASMTGQVTGEVTVEARLDSGGPVEAVTVFALDRRGRLVAAARTDVQGTVRLPAGGGQNLVLGATAPRFELRRLETLAPDRFRAVMAPVPEAALVLDPAAPPGSASAAVRVSPAAESGVKVPLGTLRVSVVDETGTGLSGVRVCAHDESTRVLAATTLSDAAGHALLVLPPGRFRLRATAPGLLAARYESGRPARVVMAVDTKVESIQIVEGTSVLRFRLEDSIDPEYYPPPPAKAWLKQQYCLDVDKMFRKASVLRHAPRGPTVRHHGLRTPFDDGSPTSATREVPLSYAARQLNLAPYWWLKKLYTDPPGVCHHASRIGRPLLPW